MKTNNLKIGLLVLAALLVIGGSWDWMRIQRFRHNVAQVKVGDSKATVEALLGKPDYWKGKNIFAGNPEETWGYTEKQFVVKELWEKVNIRLRGPSLSSSFTYDGYIIPFDEKGDVSSPPIRGTHSLITLVK